MTQIASPSIPQSEIESLEQLYTLRERAEVLQFLEKYPFLVPVLLEAPSSIRQDFPDEPLFIKVVPDPEIVDYVQLVLSILTTIDPHEAVNRLHHLDKNWLLNLSHEVRERLCTLLEYPDDF
ncbi:MAG TPA: hypothetical protein V6D12_25315 [Candidatus Obscuribacterales bacterium]